MFFFSANNNSNAFNAITDQLANTNQSKKGEEGELVIYLNRLKFKLKKKFYQGMKEVPQTNYK